MSVVEATLYLFDGFNLLHAGSYRGIEQLVDELASFVALQGARGVVVFDGHGRDVTRGPLEVRYAPDADTLIERLAAEHRDRTGSTHQQRPPGQLADRLDDKTRSQLERLRRGEKD